jgi:FMN phosphatase YigB (HAD superfamily)
MRFRAVVFDRDGVLTDFDLIAGAAFFGPRVPLSLWEISERWERWGAAIGFPKSQADEDRFFAGFWDTLCDELALPATTRRDLHRFDYTTCLAVFADAPPALRLARYTGLAVGVLSNFALASLDASLRTTGLAAWVDAACAAPVIGVAKPDLAAYRIIAERLAVEPQECLFFDDEAICVAGARAAGMTAYRVDRSRVAHDLPAGVVADLSALGLLLGV